MPTSPHPAALKAKAQAKVDALVASTPTVKAAALNSVAAAQAATEADLRQVFGREVDPLT